ncbi:hypothetical protein C1N74_07665 [Microbacterium sp. SGAir0570]|uniref:HNH endonuclease n=1 Tax=Microbacterium sp. SGAir0570 TaxID=2070348 RepID=UPI0010CCD205|nr:HNH endonuclease [Microbacterium sp. SGAir0570]QCR40310.1 hypothetical protein C1N74_07665 [Microbacterium sp. SGAir0570]
MDQPMSVHSARGAAWNRVRLACLERDLYVCQYCGGVATTADHVIARSKGGPDELWNLVAACNPCNGRKSDRPILRRFWRDESWFRR